MDLLSADLLKDLLTVLALQGGYNTTIVCLGVAALGAAGALVGVFVTLRGRAMVSDALGHATLPGVCLAFIASAWFLEGQRSLLVLSVAALATALIALVAIHAIARHTRLPEDTAIATILGTFFAAGMVLLSAIQTMQTGGQAGLEGYLLGSTAGMLFAEAVTIGIAGLVIALVSAVAFKEFLLVCIDRDYAEARGWAAGHIDAALMAALLAVVVIGLKAVGIILIIALITIPPATARLWSHNLGRLAPIAACVGAIGSYVGAGLSAIRPDLPTGALVVLVQAALFATSMIFAPHRGLVAMAARRLQQRLYLKRQAALIAGGAKELIVRLDLAARGLASIDGALTEKGRTAAIEAGRQRALWSAYLSDAPDEAFAAPGFGLQPIENCLPPDRIAALEQGLG